MIHYQDLSALIKMSASCDGVWYHGTLLHGVRLRWLSACS